MRLSGEIAARGPLRRTKGGAYYGNTHLNLDGACDEGIMIFRVCQAACAAAAASGPARLPWL